MDKYDPHGEPFIAMVPGVVRLFHGAFSAIFKPFRRALTSAQIILMKLLYPKHTHIHIRNVICIFIQFLIGKFLIYYCLKQYIHLLFIMLTQHWNERFDLKS